MPETLTGSTHAERAMTQVFSAEGVSKRFGGVQALHSVDFEIRAGEVTGLLGENGAGKSTLIKIMSGLYRPDAGTLAVDGRAVQARNVREVQALGVQTVHQELELAPPLSVAENIYMGRLPTRRGMVDRRALMAEAGQLLARLKMPIAPDALVRNLSVAGQQMVEIARALCRDARFLILDEPTAALPPSEVTALLAVVRSLADSGVGFVFVTHRLDEITRVCDSVVVLRDGRRVARLTHGQLDRATMLRHILGRDLDEAPPRRSAVVRDAALQVKGLSSDADLDGLTFSASTQEVLGFFGLLGAGQGAIGDSLFGLRQAAAESVSFGESTALPRSPQEAVGCGMAYVPADRKGAGLAMGLSIAENLALPNFARFAQAGVLRRGVLREHAQAMVRRFQIRCRDAQQPVRELSGGNQQKVSFAKWLSRDIKLLFVDEPSRGVDVGARQDLYTHLRTLSTQGCVVLFASSDPSEIVALADRVLVLRRGRVNAELVGDEITEAALVGAAI